jgi:hypothetical protein
MIRKILAAVVATAFVSGQAPAHDDKPVKPKPKPEAAKDAKDHKKDEHKGKDHDKKH